MSVSEIQLPVTPSFCGRQVPQHAAKPGFIAQAGPLRNAGNIAGARHFGALQHDSVQFSAATPYFF
ncbi:hypothetical protein CN183_19725 [Sinorhizobium medicae]|nr:hypothetical protein CN183_19725 [Sinorhizobium medicae]